MVAKVASVSLFLSRADGSVARKSNANKLELVVDGCAAKNFLVSDADRCLSLNAILK